MTLDLAMVLNYNTKGIGNKKEKDKLDFMKV